MNRQKHFSIIGPGVMAEAIIIGLIKKEVIPAGNITAAGPRQERLDQLAASYQIVTDLNNAAAVTNPLTS